jgi:RNA polymerase sigma-70 factor (ECF subfamily)
MEPASQAKFVELFLANQHRIYRFVAAAVPRWVEAEEIFQQTCLTVWERWEQFDQQQDFACWASGIAMNHLRNHVRKKQSHQVLFDDDMLEQLVVVQTEHQSLLDDMQSALTECLEKLSVEDRRLLQQSYIDEVSIKSLAESEGRTPNSLYKVLRRIRRVLYDCTTRAVARGIST